MSDPLVDLRPGDVVIYGPQWQSERLDVEAVDQYGLVLFRRMDGSSGHIDGRTWREWMKGAEVIHVAND